MHSAFKRSLSIARRASISAFVISAAPQSMRAFGDAVDVATVVDAGCAVTGALGVATAGTTTALPGAKELLAFARSAHVGTTTGAEVGVGAGAPAAAAAAVAVAGAVAVTAAAAVAAVAAATAAAAAATGDNSAGGACTCCHSGSSCSPSCCSC